MRPRPTTIRLRARVPSRPSASPSAAARPSSCPTAHAETPRPASAPAAPATRARAAVPRPARPARPPRSSWPACRSRVRRSTRPSTDYGEVDALHSEVRARRHDLDHTTTVLQGRVRELDTIRASASARIAGLSSRLDAIDGGHPGARRPGLRGGRRRRAHSTRRWCRRPLRSATSSGATSSAASRWRCSSPSGRPTEARIDEARARAETAVRRRGRGPSRARRSSARSDRPRCGMRSTRPDGSPRSASPTRRHACSPRSRAWSSRSSPSTPTTARADVGRRGAARLRRALVGHRRHLPRRGTPRHLRRHHPPSRTATPPAASSASSSTGAARRPSSATPTAAPSTATPAFDRAVGPMQFIPQTWSTVPGRRQRRRHDLAVQPLRRHPGGRQLPVHRRAAGSTPTPACAPPTSPTTTPCAYVDAVLGYARHYEGRIDVPEPDRSRPDPSVKKGGGVLLTG